ncbi:glutathione S-transferase [Zobellella endophytica]|uniref:Glutathione S-transferase n=1 Tax=Zobellella endophytica TaxID=2116700 RepID=A0A2P7RC32_9GAMM|nr:glutathione S-transferase family protein [Zobellella endophytica]PSJ47798.1 glutathione S-transferase [Zobellella endophytica]
MLKLHGVAISNYYNMVKQSLLEKGLPFEEVFQPPGQQAGFLAHSPMGKIPLLQTEQGYLTESLAIMEYLEEIRPVPRLMPVAPFERARVRQLILMAQLYLDAPARRHLDHVLFGTPLSAEAHGQVKSELERGMKALARLSNGFPWLAGAGFSYADIVLLHSLGLVELVSRQLYRWDPLADYPGLRAWQARMVGREHSQRVLTEQRQALATFRAA